MNAEHLSIEATVQIKPAKLYFISFIRGFAILNDAQIRAVIKKASVPLTKCLTKLVALYAEEKTPRNRAIPDLQHDQVKKATKSLRNARKRRSNGKSVKMQLQKKTALLKLIAKDFVSQVLAHDQQKKIGDDAFNPFVELSEMFQLEKPNPMTMTKVPITTVYEVRDTIVV